jgi:DNA helicase-2/ATP-dependent DNA helicase PcrA
MEDPTAGIEKRELSAPVIKTPYEKELALLLNTDQLKSVVAPVNSAILVTASPGSGKTRLLTYRVAYLIKEKRIPESRIMCLTFTVKAAKEMESRIAKLIREEEEMETNSLKLYCGTFHSIAFRLIREQNYAKATVLDQEDSRKFVQSCLEDLNISPTLIYEPGKLTYLISEYKSTLNYELRPIESTAEQRREYGGNLKRIFDLYTKKTLDCNKLDFADLLQYAVKMLQDPERRQRVASKFDYVTIDEFQDTNELQLGKWLLSSAAR